jgi:hypothetical protein
MVLHPLRTRNAPRFRRGRILSPSSAHAAETKMQSVSTRGRTISTRSLRLRSGLIVSGMPARARVGTDLAQLRNSSRILLTAESSRPRLKFVFFQGAFR